MTTCGVRALDLPKRILVFGATGAVGQIFCAEALAASHRLTIYTRSPTKLPESITRHPSVTIVKGDLDDKDGLRKIAQCGGTIFVSFAGPSAGTKGTPISDALKILLPQLVDNNFERAIILSTPSYVVPEDKGAFKWTCLITLVKLISSSAYREVIGLGEVTASQPVDKLKWTVFRVPYLTNSPAAPVKATFTGSGVDGMTLSRSSMAAWVLQEIDEEKWVGRAPLLCN